MQAVSLRLACNKDAFLMRVPRVVTRLKQQRKEPLNVVKGTLRRG